MENKNFYFFRPTWAEIRLNYLKHNLEEIKNIIGNETKIIAVIKADAYGHGAIKIAQKLEELKIDYLAVATLEEAIELRENGIKTPILIFGFIFPKDLQYLFKYQLTPSVFSIETAKRLNQLGEKFNKKINIHIKIDTGMNRLGFYYESAIDVVKKILKMKNLKIEGIYSHLSSSKIKNDPFNNLQFKRFKEILNQLEKNLKIEIPFKHIANSGAIVNYPRFKLNTVRIGEILYGFSTFYFKNKKIPLKQLISLKTKIIFLKTVKKGEPIGYDRTFVTKKETKIATLPIGYADGYPRILSNKGEVIVKNKKVPIVGNICMDLMMIDVSQVKNVKLLDTVILIGKQNKQKITIEELALKSLTIPDEIVSRIGKRVPKVYLD